MPNLGLYILLDFQNKKFLSQIVIIVKVILTTFGDSNGGAIHRNKRLIRAFSLSNIGAVNQFPRKLYLA